MLQPPSRLLPLATIALPTLGVLPAAGQPINEDIVLLASDGSESNQFGSSIAIDSGIIAVGARFDNDNGSNSGSAYLFDAVTGVQLFKILASDGAAVDQFGYSIAIDNGVVAVGAIGDNANGNFSGSAYLFDAATGAQLFKLVANDGAEGDSFGYSIAIADGIVAVGAAQDGDNGSNSGSAYLFDASTGEQIAKLLPSDGTAGNLFGWSIAIDNGIVAVGANEDDDNGNSSGSAYLFDTSSGEQLFKLLPSDGAFADQFGYSIAIDNGVVAVGAWVDDDNGDNSGSAYLFDASTGTQLFKLLPNDGAPFDSFGNYIAIDEDVVAVGAWLNDDDGSNSGSAYLFDASTGRQIAKLLPNNGANDAWFGWSVAIGDGMVGVGAIGDDTNGSFSGSAYVYFFDSDGDGLLDDWETNGIQYTDGNGDEQHFMLPGADPLHKDLYIEIDSMVGLGFDPAARTAVIAAFANAPNDLVDNPDGLDGITIHLQVDEEGLGVIPFPNNWVEFDSVKSTHFGTPAEQGNSPLLAAKARAYRYCIFGLSHGDDLSSGLAELPGNDFMVTMGMWPIPGGTVAQQAGTFMHELGHTLNLGHGGVSDIGAADHDNRKPNYYSVMSYTWQFPVASYAHFWRLDYSHVALGALDESGLIEGNGIDAGNSDLATILTLYGGGGEPPQLRWDAADGTPIDWNGNGETDPDPVEVDINYIFQCGSVPCPTPGDRLLGRADWPNLRYRVLGHSSSADGVHDVTTEETEMTLEIFEQMAKTPPPPSDCPADLNSDGELNFFDVSDFLVLFQLNDPLADFTGDGLYNFFDVSAFLTAFGAGCP
jgi:FG-GAP repeat